MPRTTPSRMRRVRAIVSSSTVPGAKAPDAGAASSGGLKPAPTKLAERDSSDAPGDPPDASGDSTEASAGFVGRGFSRDIASDQIEGALAPEAPEVIGPNRSESSTGIGPPPFVKMSHKVPPAPLTAPSTHSPSIESLAR